MIDLGVLHIDWINEASAINNKADKILVEKVIRALLLLEGLSSSGLGLACSAFAGSPSCLQKCKRIE